MITLPTPIPELAARHEMHPDDPRLLPAILRDHAQAPAGHVVPITELRPEALARHDAKFHPRGLVYRVNPFQRAIAHHRERPGSLIAEWSCLALIGLGEFATGADTTILCSHDRRLAEDALQPTLRRRKKHHATSLLKLGNVLMAATPSMLTLTACLRSLDKGEHAWDTMADLDLDPVSIMSVQLIDRFCHVLGVSHDDIRSQLAGKYNVRRLTGLLELSCPRTESKPETILRLLAGEAVAGLPWVDFTSQIPVYTDGTIGEPGTKLRATTLLTVFDQADRRLKVGLMYDGEHHLQRKQRDKDAEITADLMSRGVDGAPGVGRDAAEDSRNQAAGT